MPGLYPQPIINVSAVARQNWLVARAKAEAVEERMKAQAYALARKEAQLAAAAVEKQAEARLKAIEKRRKEKIKRREQVRERPTIPSSTSTGCACPPLSSFLLLHDSC